MRREASWAIDDYEYGCDCCETYDPRGICLVWHDLTEERSHFGLCFNCLEKLYFEYLGPKEAIKVKRKVVPEELRNEIFKRDGYQCVECNSNKNLQLDHIKPFSHGGKTEKENLKTLCKKCNLSKGNRFE
jgi:hypothetical protein